MVSHSPYGNFLPDIRKKIPAAVFMHYSEYASVFPQSDPTYTADTIAPVLPDWHSDYIIFTL